MATRAWVTAPPSNIRAAPRARLIRPAVIAESLLQLVGRYPVGHRHRDAVRGHHEGLQTPSGTRSAKSVMSRSRVLRMGGPDPRASLSAVLGRLLRAAVHLGRRPRPGGSRAGSLPACPARSAPIRSAVAGRASRSTAARGPGWPAESAAAAPRRPVQPSGAGGGRPAAVRGRGCDGCRQRGCWLRLAGAARCRAAAGRLSPPGGWLACCSLNRSRSRPGHGGSRIGRTRRWAAAPPGSASAGSGLRSRRWRRMGPGMATARPATAGRHRAWRSPARRRDSGPEANRPAANRAGRPARRRLPRRPRPGGLRRPVPASRRAWRPARSARREGTPRRWYRRPARGSASP